MKLDPATYMAWIDVPSTGHPHMFGSELVEKLTAAPWYAGWPPNPWVVASEWTALRCREGRQAAQSIAAPRRPWGLRWGGWFAVATDSLTTCWRLRKPGQQSS